MHELIHFIQWSIGKWNYSFEEYEIDEIDKNDIKKCFKLNEFDFKFEKNEIETYANNIFYFLKRTLKENNVKFFRSIMKSFIDSFKNEKFESFEDYFNEVNLKLSQIDNVIEKQIFSNFKNNNFIMYFYIIGFFKIGYTSLKNHLYGFYDKEF